MKNKIETQIQFEKDKMNEIPLHYTMPESIDNWRHTRMLDSISGIIDFSKNQENLSNTWVTLGDGRYGDNANYLHEKGLADVIATSITEENLKYAKDQNRIIACYGNNIEGEEFSGNREIIESQPDVIAVKSLKDLDKLFNNQPQTLF